MSPTILRRFHGWHTLLWLGPGAVASWWLRNSVPWVTLMSWYAIVMTSVDGWQAARAEDAADAQSP